MANEDYKNGKIVEIVREFDNTGSRYEINGITQSIAVPFWRKSEGKFNVIPKGSYKFINESGNDYIEITNEEILNTASQFQIVYIYSQISSKYVEDFPEINVFVMKYNELVEDTTKLFSYLKSVGITADTLQMTKVLAQLEPMTTWYLNENGEMAALPISELYGKFEQMINTLYNEIKNLLLQDYNKFTKDMLEKTEELKKELEILKNSLAEEIKKLSSDEKASITSKSEEEQNNISKFANDKKDEVINEIGQVSDEEKKELNTHTEKKKQELDEYIQLNRDDLIGPVGPRGLSVGAFKFLQDVPNGKEYEVLLENGNKLGTVMTPKGEKGADGEKGEKGDPGTAIIVPVKGQYTFQIENGMLVCYYEGETAPNFTIENGNLVLTIND